MYKKQITARLDRQRNFKNAQKSIIGPLYLSSQYLKFPNTQF